VSVPRNRSKTFEAVFGVAWNVNARYLFNLYKSLIL
jgi:hypothetical protein